MAGSSKSILSIVSFLKSLYIYIYIYTCIEICSFSVPFSTFFVVDEYLSILIKRTPPEVEITLCGRASVWQDACVLLDTWRGVFFG